MPFSTRPIRVASGVRSHGAPLGRPPEPQRPHGEAGAVCPPPLPRPGTIKVTPTTHLATSISPLTLPTSKDLLPPQSPELRGGSGAQS